MWRKNILSKRDAVYLLELIRDCASCSGLNDFIKNVKRLRQLIFFDMAICGFAMLNDKNVIKAYDVVNIDYPSEWLEVYIARKYHQVDPIVKANFDNFKLQYWTDTYKLHGHAKEFAFIAEDFGLKDGLAYGLRNYQCRGGSIFSLASNHRMDHNPRAEIILEYVVPHLHQALHRIHDNQESSKKTRNIISQREKEVLSWLKEGKSSWDISHILKISERTVNYHVCNIMQKLEAVNRVQAVSIATERGLLAID